MDTAHHCCCLVINACSVKVSLYSRLIGSRTGEYPFEFNLIPCDGSEYHVCSGVCSRSCMQVLFDLQFINSGRLFELGVVWGLSCKDSVDNIVSQVVTRQVEHSDHDIRD